MTNLSLKFVTDKEKAQTERDLGFLGLIASYEQADSLQKQQHQAVITLNKMLSEDKFYYVNDEITFDGEFRPTANSIAVLMHNRGGEPSNLAIYPLNGSKPFMLNPYGYDDCFIVGFGSELIAIEDIDEASEIYQHLGYNAEQHYTLTVPFNEREFDNLVKAYAKHRQVNVYTPLFMLNEQKVKFKNYRVKLIGISEPPLSDMLKYESLGEIEQLEDTKISILGGYEWGELEPLDSNQITIATRYPIEAFKGILRDAVEAIAYHAQVPQAMAGQCVLGALSTIGQRYVNAPKTHGNQYSPTSLFLITEGDSGSGKTFASGLSHQSINRWDEHTYKNYIELFREWQTDLDSLKGKERKEYLQNNAKPKNESMIIQEGTIEAVLDHFILDDKDNLSWTTDDAGQFFNGHTMKGDTAGNAIASLAKLWDGSPVSRHRSQRGANPQFKTNAYNVRLTLDLQGQRVILEPALTDPMLLQQGFLARALLACPESLQGKRDWNSSERLDNSPHNDPRLQAYWSRCDILLNPLPSEIKTDDNGKQVRLNMSFANRQARQALADFQQIVENRQAKGNAYEFLRAFASRMAQNASRIASLMAFFDCHETVTVEYLERAFLLVEYSTTERLRYLEIKNHEKTNSQKLIEWVVKHCKANKVKMLSYADTQSKVSVRALRRKAEFELAIAVLVEKKYIRVINSGNSRYIEVRPQLLE